MATRWRCAECECINDKHPAFKFNDASPSRIIEENGKKLKLIIATCTNTSCRHASSVHSFTLESPHKKP